MNYRWKSVAPMVLAAFIFANPAQACWTSVERDAAKIANLNMMMMVTALRCRKGPNDFIAEYNHFVENNNPVIGSQNAAVRAHFVRLNGPNGADAAVDKFVIAIANSYGGGHRRLGCAELKVVASDIARPGQSVVGLLAVAEQNIDETDFVGEKCPTAIASK